MADNMTSIEQAGKPKPQEVAHRWMKARGIHRPPEDGQNKVDAIEPPTLVSEAYDLFVERQDLRDQVVRSERQMLEPKGTQQSTFAAVSAEWDAVLNGKAPERALSLDEKRELIRQGRVGTLMPTTDFEGSDVEIVGKSQARINELEGRLDQIFSTQQTYEMFQNDLSHQVGVRRNAREVTALGKFGQEAELLALKLSRRAQVAGRQLTSVEKQVIEDNQALRSEIDGRLAELVQDPEVFDQLRIMELQKYRRQLEKDHYAETPSRQEYLKRIEGYWAEGKKVLLSGETGTGKTEMVKHASNKLFGVNPEPVTGHQDMSIYELLGKTGFQVQVGDVFRPAPLIRAMTGRNGRGQPFLFDEIDRAPNQAVMGIKTILNARPGEKGIRVQTDTAGSFDVGPDYAVSATANIKSEKYATATELDPAIVRVFDAPLEIGYMPADEVYDLALASLLDRRGGVPLSEQDAKTILKNLCDAASWVQDTYQGRKVVTDLKSGKILEARGQGSTGHSASLKKALLDPGRTIDMLNGWSGASVRGASFEDYTNERVLEFINNRAYPEDDRYYLTEIFALKGFLKGIRVDQLSVPGLTQAVLDRWTGSARKQREKQVTKASYLSADRVAQLDPYRRFTRPIAQEAEELLGVAEEATPTGEGAVSAEFERAREILGKDFLGPEAIEKAFGITLDAGSIPEIPFSEEELERAVANGEYLILRIDRKDDGTPLTIQEMVTMLQPQFDRDSKGKIMYNVDWYKSENFFTKDAPRPAWRLVSKNLIPGSTSKNYLQQTEVLADYIKNTEFAGLPLPADFDEAIREFESQKGGIGKILTSKWEQAAKQLADLKLNQMARQTPVEERYDFLMYFQNNDERLHENDYVWTNRQASDGLLVYVGDARAAGADVGDWLPGRTYGRVGVGLSR